MTPVAESGAPASQISGEQATGSSIAARAPSSAARGVLGSCGIAFLVTALIGGAVWASGLLPVEARSFIGWGWCAALISGLVGMIVLTKFTTVQDHDDPGRVARLYVAGLGIFLGLQIAVVLVAIVALSVQGQKFPALATFGLTFAATAWAVQVTGSLAISRFLRIRAASIADALQTNDPR